MSVRPTTSKRRRFAAWRRALGRAFALAIAAVTMSVVAPDAYAQLSAMVELERDRVYLHEPFSVTMKVSSSGVRIGRGIEIKGLPEDGRLRWTKDGELAPSRTVRDGKVVETRSFRFSVLPLKDGTANLEFTFAIGVVEMNPVFFGDPFVEKPVDVRAPVTNVVVLPLPEKDKPAGFSGAVGQFDFAVDVSPTDVSVGSLVTATMKIQGKGYIEDIVPPASSPGKDFKVYEPKKMSEKPNQEVVFQQILVPQSTNAATVPPFTFSFFDPREGRYKTIARGPFPLKYHAPRAADPTAVGFTNVNRTASTPGTNKIATIAPPLSAPLSTREAALLIERSWNTDPWVWVTVLLVVFVVVLLLVILRALDRLAGRRMKRFLVLALIAALLIGAGAGIRYSVNKVLSAGSKAVCVSACKARFAPSELAIESFDVPAGTRVQVHAVHGDWAKISSRNRRGWVAVKALARAGR